MKTVTVLLHKDEIDLYKEVGLDMVAIATEGLSAKGYPGFSMDSMKEIVDQLNGVKLPWAWILPTLILEADFELFKQQAQQMMEFSCSCVIVSDVGAFDYLKQLNPDLFIILQTDTTIPNPYDVLEFLDLGVSSVGLARECTFEEIQGIVQVTPHVMIHVFGYQLMSISKRPLMSNYFKFIKKTPLPLYTEVILKEEKRDEVYRAIEDTSGFSIYTPTVLEMFDEIKQIDHPLLFGWIEPMFLPTDVITKAVHLFKTKANSEDAVATLTKLSEVKYAKGLLYTPTSATREVAI